MTQRAHPAQHHERATPPHPCQCVTSLLTNRHTHTSLTLTLETLRLLQTGACKAAAEREPSYSGNSRATEFIVNQELAGKQVKSACVRASFALGPVWHRACRYGDDAGHH